MKSNKTVTDSSISETWFNLVTPKAKHHLLSSLSNLRSGAPTTPSFKLYGKDDWSVVADFLTKVQSDKTVPKWLLAYEFSREEKFGPQGGHAPWDELVDDAKLYFTRPQPVADHSCDVSKYKQLTCRLQSYPEVLATLKGDDKIQTRAAGWRAFDLKKTDPQAQRMALEDLHSGMWKLGWAYFFSRYNKMKKRLFVPMPFSNMIGQAQYFNPFLKQIQNNLRLFKSASEFRFWGDKIGFKDCFHSIVEPLCKGLDPSHIVYVMRDFEKMDTTTGVDQKASFFLPKLGAAFGFGPKTKAYEQMSEMILFSNRCPIATPDGMWTGNHGEASGATVTNGGETCCNEEYNRIFNEKLKELAKDIAFREIISLGNGDDGISLYYLEDVSKFETFASYVREAAEYAAKQTGFRIQAEKWDIHLGTYGKYCQYLVSWDGDSLHAMYPAALAINSIVNPEKEYKASEWDKDYRDIDIIMKLTPCVELPYFHKLIDYVDNGMKYGLLGRTEEATRRILSKYDKYKSLQDGHLEFNIYDDEYKGLENNPVVKYILNKRKF